MSSTTTSLTEYLEPPKKPEGDGQTEQAMRKYCEEYAKWILMSDASFRIRILSSSSTSGTQSKSYIPKSTSISAYKTTSGRRASMPVVNQAPFPAYHRRASVAKSPTSPSFSISESPSLSMSSSDEISEGRIKKARTVDDGSAVWMQACIDASPDLEDHVAETTRHYSLLNTSTLGADAEGTDLCILRFVVPSSIVHLHSSDAEVLVLFTLGLHTLISRLLSTKLHSQFTLQSLQDKLGMRRKVPIPVLALFCEHYVTTGRMSRESDLDRKTNSTTVFKKTSDMTMNPSEIAELASLL